MLTDAEKAMVSEIAQSGVVHVLLVTCLGELAKQRTDGDAWLRGLRAIVINTMLQQQEETGADLPSHLLQACRDEIHASVGSMIEQARAFL